LITTIALLALVDGSAAIAQPAGPRNPAAPPSVNSYQQMLPEAPAGHRQPRADQVPSEKNLMNPNDPVNQENAALDAKWVRSLKSAVKAEAAQGAASLD
jgi:hypothetical protein